MRYPATISIEVTQSKTKELHHWAVKKVTYLSCLTTCWLYTFIKRTAIKIIFLELNTVMDPYSSLTRPMPTVTWGVRKSDWSTGRKSAPFIPCTDTFWTAKALFTYVLFITDDEKLCSGIRFRWLKSWLICNINQIGFSNISIYNIEPFHDFVSWMSTNIIQNSSV